MKELNIIQTKLNVRKSNKNNFGGYSYRSAEDIYEALKPLLAETKCTYVIENSVELIGDRFYIKAVGTLTNEKGESVSTSSYAREGEAGKGMCEAQNSGATISYVNKYVTSALFLLHNGEADPDATQGKPEQKPTAKTQVAQALQLKPTPSNDAGAENGKVDGKSTLNNNQPENGEVLIENVLAEIGNAQDGKELTAIYKKYKTSFKGEDNEKFVNAIKNSPVNPNRKQQ